ncbi:hypothetical protein BN8_03669 [Fibrisoma limi BUZ 3]|uniref:Pectate lyase superfamily protein domain-containing protein n=1 Tax=Fibrisoma limi BUZ 3 TaxID=1185876 RepID=I2GKR7_9BACT|nr:hypothetical protein [Fibrisoma limi]CCH54493.1 hypothetical protein BN8_03669 [Fibrisoma limi BUZ 3]
MKRVLTVLLTLLTVVSFAQITKNPRRPSLSGAFELGRSDEGLLFVRPKTGVDLLIPSLVPLSVSQVRGLNPTLTNLLPQTIAITDEGKTGVFVLDPNDTTTPDNTGTVLVTAGAKRYKRRYDTWLNPAWFGARPNDTADDAPAIQAAINHAEAIKAGIQIDEGRYVIGSTLVKAESFRGLEMRGRGRVTFAFRNLSTGSACLRIVGGSGYLTENTLQGIDFVGNAGTVAVELSGQCGQKIVACRFDSSATGVLFHNQAANSFTEYCQIDRSDFTGNCLVAVEYKVSSGNDSFHGSGLIGSNTINSKAGGRVIKIGPGCRPYNFPLCFQVWNGSADYVVIENAGYACDAYGHITVENSQPMLLCAGNYIYYTGSLHTFGDNIQGGAFLRCKSTITKNNGSVVGLGIEKNIRLDYSPTNYTVIMPAGSYQVYVNISAPNYEYRAVLYIHASGFPGFLNNPGSVSTPVVLSQFNVGSLGAPGFGIDAAGHLTITNPNYPASGLVAHLSYKQISDYEEGNYPGSHF